MKCFLLQVSSDDGEGEASYGLVVLDEEKAKRVAARRKVFDAALEKEPELYAMNFWDGTCYFYTLAAYEEIEEQLGYDRWRELDEEGLIEVDEEFSIDDEHEVRTDCDLMVVAEDGFHWEANSKHGASRFETRQLKYDVLQTML